MSIRDLDLTKDQRYILLQCNHRRKNYNGFFRVGELDSLSSSSLEIYWQNGSDGSGNLVYATNRTTNLNEFAALV